MSPGRTKSAALSVNAAICFSLNGSAATAQASRTWYCHAFSESIDLARLGADVARTARDAISGGTGVTRSGR
ncbi:unannotated protein [freshwater metagenome]|uniref:Unannotated protein n=1 Tax=freshwater metagenome TaxID=449393 RepID=A0A6J6FT18_9ZZZZ